MLTLDNLIDAGGPMAFVRKAAEEAARQEAEQWAEIVASALAKYEASGNPELTVVLMMQSWLKQMRRIAGMKPSVDEVRAQTRERVRRYRERQRAD